MTELELIYFHGEPTEQEQQHALEAFTAYRLGLTSISTLRQLSPSALSLARAEYERLRNT